jgi:DNA-binding NarL/FixJ family response regulator
MIHILIVDDHAIVRRGLKEILVRDLGGVYAGEAASADQALLQIDQKPWDLVILDIAMPRRSGIDVLRQIRAVKPKLPVLVLSMYSEAQYGRRVLKAGGSGYMVKESAPEELITAVRQVLSGRRYITPALAEALASQLQNDNGQPLHESLSDRELEVLRLLGGGKSVGKIAQDLGLSVPTVSTYRARLLEKLSLSTTAELIRYAIRHHLVD